MPAESAQKRLWTLDEFYKARDAAPQGMRYEYVDGEILVTPSPHWTHQRIATDLLALLIPYVRSHAFGRGTLRVGYPSVLQRGLA